MQLGVKLDPRVARANDALVRELGEPVVALVLLLVALFMFGAARVPAAPAHRVHRAPDARTVARR